MMNWREIRKIAAAGYICLATLTVSAQSGEGSRILVIDPGHGGRDPGAIGVNTIKEKDMVLHLAREILKHNKEKYGYDIYLTRYKDTLISLGERTRLAKSLKADLFISLHCNHSDNPSARGNEIFVANTRRTPNLEASILLANRISVTISEELGLMNRGVKFSNFQVLRDTINNFPSILIEICFLSNKEEAAYLTKTGVLKTLAILILASL